MRMRELLADVDVLDTVGDLDAVEIRGVEHNSRRVVPGDLFCCLVGVQVDGHNFASDAVSRGAVGIICEHLIPELFESGVVQCQISVGSARHTMAHLARVFHGTPAADLLMVGVTGTNGKTTVTQILGELLEFSGRPTNVLGTLSGSRTTPEATELQRILASVRDRQRSDGRPHAVVMEVSSHALVQSRVDEISFDLAIFTNLSHEHLDFHGDMNSYFEAKAKLFTPEFAKRAIINVDDVWGQRLASQVEIPIKTFKRSDVRDISLQAGLTTFTWRDRKITTPLTGSFNVDNVLLASEAALELGMDLDTIERGLAQVSVIPGRLEVITAGLPKERIKAWDGKSPEFTVLVDYAHTPAGLEVVLSEARSLVSQGSKVLLVFGCGGDRDRSKRPLMGAVAAGLADAAFVTSDNPRNEDPVDIVSEIQSGMGRYLEIPGRVRVELDRYLAISEALREAKEGDVVVIAGKGHEGYQEIKGKYFEFDDRKVTIEILKKYYGDDSIEDSIEKGNL